MSNLSGMIATAVARRSRRRLPALGLATALLLGGGSSLIAGALTDGPAAADGALGGFTVTALAEASTAQYEQPNFPLPATPTFEFSQGYAATTDNYGPTGSATASTLYPGQVIANSGPDAALLFPGAPIPPLPIWPIEAVSDYPAAPNSASTDKPGVNMDATSTANANTATATIGDNAPGAGATGTTATSGLPSVGSLTGALGSLAGISTNPTTTNPLGSASSFMGINYSSGTSTSGTTASAATATATATDSGIAILGGLINIGSVTSTATATSNGTTGAVSGSTVASNVTVGGVPVTVSTSGIQAAGSGSPGAPSTAVLNSLLGQLGMTMTVANPTDAVSGASASRTLDGLRISVNITTLDAAANKLSSLLPASFTSKLPLAIPNEQVLTMDLGTVSVGSTASPAFILPFTPTVAAPVLPATTSNTGNTGTSVTSGNTGNTGSGSTLGTSGGFGAGGTPTGNSGAPTGGTASGQPTAAISPVFGGIGAALVAAGLLVASAMAYAYRRFEDLTELESLDCVNADPQTEFSNPVGGTVPDAGGSVA
ncbi:MAG TPA: hypothetical protein VND70_08645 [Acidimicrobiales bacterium]|nr:hypothetical protein [Acidimicrobiales bacterium]